ncbi:hypothetical protein BU24DRAFT_451517 [Aaosphaeria arxii CBS 175.79]|uniref:Uncharacterized protein n=1 Tax=Aaosphaeria arxii CBS 175.79 TaxID=1450172 RepID=A0A6A5XMZ7_9PLEO|nr:uncharacterized protein BU24DRAFT_451517 [Aaosphaeria arxii CBS 175.79]KAF2014492.1 hypothetical protein BU24DRAFT_451517 [Aaosphaeria arxii CBS 175.79]
MATKIDLHAIKSRSWTTQTTHTLQQMISYNLALGASGTCLPLVFESSPSFHALPTFGTVPTIAVMGKVHAAMGDFLPGFKGHNHVHGEHFLKLIRPYPVPKGGAEGKVTLTTTARVVDVGKRGNGVLVCVEILTTCGESGVLICENEWSGFVMHVPSDGANTGLMDRGPRTRLYNTPSRKPDRVLSHRTSPEQAALYRAASGDLNPLHIDPDTAKTAGFPAPLLTGTCTLGIGVRHVVEAFAGGNADRFSSVKCRLSKPVFAALRDELFTEMWKEEGGKILFRIVVKEEPGKERVVISQGCILLHDDQVSKL